jgi:hypothetical protein
VCRPTCAAVTARSSARSKSGSANFPSEPTALTLGHPSPRLPAQARDWPRSSQPATGPLPVQLAAARAAQRRGARAGQELLPLGELRLRPLMPST